MTTSGVIRFEQPKSSRGQKKANVVYEIHPVSGFADFLREHTVITLAVGFAIATQAQALIKQLIASFLDPLYGLLFSQKLSHKAFVLHFHDRSQSFAWGAFINTFVDFLFVLLAIYLIIRFLQLDRLNKKPADSDK